MSNEIEKKEDQPDKQSDESASFLKNILGNALGSSMKYEQSKAELETKKCPNCSAARPADTNLQFCDYCGHKFF